MGLITSYLKQLIQLNVNKMRWAKLEITDFYKTKIKQIEVDILDAENRKDFKQVAKLQAEKAECKKKLNE